MLEAPSIDSARSEGVSSPMGELSSAMKFARAYDLMFPWGYIGCRIRRVTLPKILSFLLNHASLKLDEHDSWFLLGSCDHECTVSVSSS